MCVYGSIVLHKCGGAVDVCCQAWCWILWILLTDALFEFRGFSIDRNWEDKVDILHMEGKEGLKEGERAFSGQSRLSARSFFQQRAVSHRLYHTGSFPVTTRTLNCTVDYWEAPAASKYGTPGMVWQCLMHLSQMDCEILLPLQHSLYPVNFVCHRSCSHPANLICVLTISCFVSQHCNQHPKSRKKM